MAVEDADGVFSRSISQLVSLLRTSFQSKEFDEVEEILVAREVKFKKEVKKKEKENEFLRSKLELTRLEKVRVEAELEELREKAEELLKAIDPDSSEAQERKKRYEKSLEEAKKKREPELNQKRTKIFDIRNKLSDKIETNDLRKGGIRERKKQMAIAGNGSVSPVIMVQIMGSDNESPGKALCVKRNSSGNLEDSLRTNVELHKRKRDSFSKSSPNKVEADDQNDIIPGSYFTWKPQEIVANTDNTFGYAIPLTREENEKQKSRHKQGQTSCSQCKKNARDKPSSLNCGCQFVYR